MNHRFKRNPEIITRKHQLAVPEMLLRLRKYHEIPKAIGAIAAIEEQSQWDQPYTQYIKTDFADLEFMHAQIFIKKWHHKENTDRPCCHRKKATGASQPPVFMPQEIEENQRKA